VGGGGGGGWGGSCRTGTPDFDVESWRVGNEVDSLYAIES